MSDALNDYVDGLESDIESAVDVLRDIANMPVGKKNAGIETARNWLWSHGYALEEGGYIPGKGFEDSVRTGPSNTVRTVAAEGAGAVTRTNDDNSIGNWWGWNPHG